MSISVIIPAYNYARFLPRTLRSVVTQSVDVPVDILVVDDGSTDHTAQVVADFGTRVRYIHQHNQGLSAARNTGMAGASGEALLFLDADDILLPGTLQSQWDTLQTSGADLSICHNYMVDAPEPDSPLRVVGFYPLHTASHAVHICHANPAPIHAFLVRREAAQTAGLFDTTLAGCEDYDFWWRCFFTGARAVSNPNAVVAYRKHTNSMSTHKERQAVHEALCSARVGGDLRTCTDFLSQRKPDAFMAHATGSLKRATLTLPFDTRLTMTLLDQAGSAVRSALRAGLEHAFLNSDTARTDDEVRVLHYYILRTLYYMQYFDTVPHKGVDDARATLCALVPDSILSERDAHIQALQEHIFIMPDLSRMDSTTLELAYDYR